MIYTQIPATYKYDVLADAIYSREMEHFHYRLDAVNFTNLLETIEEGAYKQELQGRLASTLEQMAKVDSIYNALTAQIENPVMYAAAVERAAQKRSTAA